MGEGCHINYSLYLSRAPLSITLKHLRIPDYAEGGERRPHYNASLENHKLIARIYVLDVKVDLLRLSLLRDMSYLSQMFQYQREF